MKYLAILLLFFFHSASGQIKTGTYFFASNDTTSFTGNNALARALQSQRFFSELTFFPDSTFVYNYRTSFGCLLWYDSKGEWCIDKDKIILTDYVLGTTRTHISDTTFTAAMIFRKTIFDIRNDSLFFSEQTYDRFKPAYYPLRHLFGNYAYKE